MKDERETLLEHITALHNETAEEAAAYARDYQEKRLYIAQKLQEKFPDQKLINFHFTAGTRKDVTKEELWGEIEKIYKAPSRSVTAAELDDEIRGKRRDQPPMSGRPKINLRELVKTL